MKIAGVRASMEKSVKSLRVIREYVCVLNKLSVRADTQIDEKCREWKKIQQSETGKKASKFG